LSGGRRGARASITRKLPNSPVAESGRFHCAPMDTMRLMEPYAVQDLGYDLCALCDGHAATVEEEVAIRECDLAAADCLKLSPPRISLQPALFSEAALQVEATRRNDEVLRIELQQ